MMKRLIPLMMLLSLMIWGCKQGSDNKKEEEEEITEELEDANADTMTESVSNDDEDLDERPLIMQAFRLGGYEYVVDDNMPNSNGWIIRFTVIRTNPHTNETKHIGAFAAVHFEKDGFRVATARQTNPDAICTADEKYLIRDNFYRADGVFIRKGESEYVYSEMEAKYGKHLVGGYGHIYP